MQLQLLLAIAKRHGTVEWSVEKGAIEEELARIFDLTPEQLELTTNDGEGRNRWDNWLRQVKRMLVKKKYLDDSIHDVWRITDRGMQWLEKKGYWQQFPA